MTLTIDLTPDEREEESVKVEEVARNAASIGLLRGWLRDEATDDPAQIQKAQEELDEFKRNMNTSRAESGERLPYPEVEPVGKA